MDFGLKYLLRGFFVTLTVLLFTLSLVGALLSFNKGLYFFLLGMMFMGVSVSKKSFIWKIFRKVPGLKSIKFKKYLFKNEDRRMRLFAFLTIRALFIFLIVAFFIKSYEFIFYGTLLLILFIFVYLMHRRIHLHLPVFVLICVLFLVHVTGGVLMLRGFNIYEKGIGMLNYGHFVHFLGTFVVVFVFYSLIHHYFKSKKKRFEFTLFFSLIGLSMAFAGTFNLIENAAALFFNFTPNIKSYFSDKIDVIGNLVVASLASYVVILYHRNKYFKEFINGWKFFG